MLKRKPPVDNVRRVRSIEQNIRGVFTNKVNRIVQFESWQERALCLQLDRDLSVNDYSSQPETFSFIDDKDGKLHKYTPDFIVWKLNKGTEIHEVTLTERQNHLDIQRREKAAHKICQERGWSYIVHTEQSLPKDAELANLLALVRYRPTSYSNQDVRKLAIRLLEVSKVIPLRSLITQISGQLAISQPNVLATMCHLIWHGEISIDLKKLLFVDGSIAPNLMARPDLAQKED